MPPLGETIRTTMNSAAERIAPERIKSITFLAAQCVRNPRGCSVLRVVADDIFPVREELRACRYAPRRMVILRLRFFIRRDADKLVIFQQLRFRDAAPTAYLCKAIARADGEKANN
jgi:hypothetical protein